MSTEKLLTSAKLPHWFVWFSSYLNTHIQLFNKPCVLILIISFVSMNQHRFIANLRNSKIRFSWCLYTEKHQYGNYEHFVGHKQSFPFNFWKTKTTSSCLNNNSNKYILNQGIYWIYFLWVSTTFMMRTTTHMKTIRTKF